MWKAIKTIGQGLAAIRGWWWAPWLDFKLYSSFLSSQGALYTLEAAYPLEALLGADAPADEG